MKCLEINFETYSEIKNAQAFWVNAVIIEELYDIMIENFYELERELLQVSTRHMLFNINGFEFRDQVGLINRRILNFLASTTMYLDHTCKHLKKMYGRNSEAVKNNKDFIVSEKAKNLGFRSLKYIRNYAQHQGYAVENFSVGGGWKDVDDENLNVFDVHTYLSKDSINNKERDNSSISDFIDPKKEVQIQNLMRDAMGSLSYVHDNIREILAVDHCKSIQSTAICEHLAKSEFEKDCSEITIYILSIEDETNSTEKTYIVSDQMRRCERFISKNKPKARLTDCRVMS